MSIGRFHFTLRWATVHTPCQRQFYTQFSLCPLQSKAQFETRRVIGRTIDATERLRLAYKNLLFLGEKAARNSQV